MMTSNQLDIRLTINTVNECEEDKFGSSCPNFSKSPCANGLRYHAASPKNRSGTPCPEEMLRFAKQYSASSEDNKRTTNNDEGQLTSSCNTTARLESPRNISQECVKEASAHCPESDGVAVQSPNKKRKATPIYSVSTDSERSNTSYERDRVIVVDNTIGAKIAGSQHDAILKNKMKPKPMRKEEVQLRSPRNRHLPRHDHEHSKEKVKNDRQNSITRFLSCLLSWKSSRSCQVSPTSSFSEDSYNKNRHEDPPSYRVSLRQYETLAEDKIVEFTTAFPPEVEEPTEATSGSIAISDQLTNIDESASQ